MAVIKEALSALAWLLAMDQGQPFDPGMADSSSRTPSQTVRSQTLPDCSSREVAASRRTIAVNELARLVDRKALVHVRGRLVPVVDCLLLGGSRACSTSDWIVRPRAECPSWQFIIRGMGIAARLERGGWDQDTVDVIVAGRLALESQTLVLKEAEICRLPDRENGMSAGRLMDAEADRIASRPATSRPRKPCPRFEPKLPGGSTYERATTRGR